MVADTLLEVLDGLGSAGEVNYSAIEADLDDEPSSVCDLWKQAADKLMVLDLGVPNSVNPLGRWAFDDGAGVKA